MSTIDRLNRIRALKSQIAPLHAADQPLVDSLCRIIQTYHAAMREIYSEDEITVELHSFSKEEAEHT